MRRAPALSVRARPPPPQVRPPLLPPQLQERLLRVAALPDDEQFVRRMRDTLAALAPPAVIVLRYLFAFLAQYVHTHIRTWLAAHIHTWSRLCVAASRSTASTT